MPIKDVEEVLAKYDKQENTIDSKLNLRHQQIFELNKTLLKTEKTLLTLQKAQERNKSILKDLEIVKGNLRSKAIFSPMEMQWKKIRENYCAEPSLVVTKWRCDIPVYV